MRELVEVVLDSARADFIDVRIVEKTRTNLMIQDGRADKVTSSHSLGAGIRVLIKGAWGFAATHELKKEKLLSSLKDAVAMAKASRRRILTPAGVSKAESRVDWIKMKMERDPRKISISEKINALFELEEAARKYEPKYVVNTVLNYRDIATKEIIGNSFGTYIENEMVRTEARISVTTQKDEIRQNSSRSEARLAGFELVEELTPENFSLKAAKKAVDLLQAKLAPAGEFVVILSPEIAGLLAHEALGHNAEADSVWSGESILAGKMGKKVASELVTIIDDATIPGAYGSYAYDSEGTPGQKRVIIKNGLLKNFLHSLETAEKFGVSPNGSARAEDHQSRPIVRMSNTYFAPGERSYEEILSEVKEGILVEDVGYGGYVFPERGQFMCNINTSWLIKDGRKKELLRNVSISGLTLETLKKIDAVSREFSLARFGGMCGKGGQGMYVDHGGPYLRVKELIVGGQR